MNADDVKAVSVLQSVWIKASKPVAMTKLLHAIRYVRNREAYERDKQRYRDLLTIRRHNAIRAIAEGKVVDL